MHINPLNAILITPLLLLVKPLQYFNLKMYLRCNSKHPFFKYCNSFTNNDNGYMVEVY